MNNTVILTLPNKKIKKAGSCLAGVMTGIKIGFLREVFQTNTGFYPWGSPIMANEANKNKVKDYLKNNEVKIEFKASVPQSKKATTLTPEELTLWSKVGNKLFGVPLSNGKTRDEYYKQLLDIDLNKQLWKEYAKICWYRYGSSRANDVKQFCSDYKKYGNIWVPYYLLEAKTYFESRYRICSCPTVYSNNSVLIDGTKLTYLEKVISNENFIDIRPALALRLLTRSRKKAGITLLDRFLDSSGVYNFDLSNQITEYNREITSNRKVIINKAPNKETMETLNNLFNLPLYKIKRKISGK